VDQPWGIDAIEHPEALRPHRSLVLGAIGPVRALNSHAAGFKSQSDAVVEVAIRITFDVEIDQCAFSGKCERADHVDLVRSNGKGLQGVLMLSVVASAPPGPERIRQLFHGENTFLVIPLAFLCIYLCKKTQIVRFRRDLAASRCVLALGTVFVQYEWWWRGAGLLGPYGSDNGPNLGIERWQHHRGRRVPPPVNEFTDVWQRCAHGLRENESIKCQQESVSS
jgi:hypothetical protein